MAFATLLAARAGYLATAEYAIDAQNTYSTIALILLSVASIIIGRVMLRSPVFGRRIAHVAIAAGVCSVFAPFLGIARFRRASASSGWRSEGSGNWWSV